MKQKGTMPELEDLPDIGGVLAGLLRKTGIRTPDDLYTTGAIQAFIRIRAVDSDACFSKLCALEGAVEGIRWHCIAKDKRSELLHFFNWIKK